MTGKKSGILLLLLSLTVSFFYSCEFEPHKVYQRTADENVSAPEIQVVELNLEFDDTIYLHNKKEVHFNFVSNNQEIKAIRFVIDDLERYLVNSNSGIFTLDYNSFPYGIHTLNLEVYTATGTGSIAELLGREAFLFSKTWVINVIDYEGFTNYRLTSSVSDGFLKLSWTRYPGSDLKEYILYRSEAPPEIIKAGSNYFIDSSYTGEPARYDVKVSTDDGSLSPWGVLFLAKDLPELYFSESGSKLYTVKWNKSRYYGAVDTFRLSLSTDFRLTYTTIYNTCDPDDTTHIITTAFFGDIISLKLKVIPKNSSHYSPAYYLFFESYLSDIRLGFPFSMVDGQVIQDISQVNQDEFVCIAGYNNLIRYSVSQKSIVELLSYSPSVCVPNYYHNLTTSSSGKFLTTYIYCTKEVMLANSGNLGNNSIRNLNPFGVHEYLPKIPVSDIGLMLVDSVDIGFFLYDFYTDETLAYYHKENLKAKGLAISMNGDYIILQDDSLRLVRFENSQFSSIWSHSKYTQPDFFEFHGKNPEELVIWDGSAFSVKRCSDFSDIYEFQLSDTEILDIDYFNNEMLTWSAGHLYVRSLTDGALLNDIPVNINPTYPDRSCYLVDKAIVCMRGVMYFLE